MACSREGARRWLLAACVALAPGAARGVAADSETREFNVFVDNKIAGKATMKIERRDDGNIAVACDSSVEVKVLFVTYRYTYTGKELWKDGRLQRLDSSCNDDGKQYVVSAVAEPGGLRVKVNNRERLARPDVWLTSYWGLPDPKLRGGTIPLIDADTGRDLECKLQHVGAAKMRINGEEKTVNHYRLTGKVQVDLWYDASERLARQEWIEDGHRTILELARARR
jgi:hypothetical protein